MSDIGLHISQLAADPSAGQVRKSGSAQKARPQDEDQNDATGVARAEKGEATNQDRASAAPTGGTGDQLEQLAAFLESIIPDIAPTTRLRIDHDDEAGRFVYLNVDKKSGEVVKQFPPEDLLKFIAQFRETAGLLIDDEV